MGPENDVSTLWAKLTKLALQLSSDKEGWAALKPAQIREYRRRGLFRAKGPTHEARELWQEKTDPDSRFWVEQILPSQWRPLRLRFAESEEAERAQRSRADAQG